MKWWQWAIVISGALLASAGIYILILDRKGRAVKESTDTGEFPNFSWSEFDSRALAGEAANPNVATYLKNGKPYLAGSGKQHMNRTFMAMLQEARTIAGIPFTINSGYRTPQYNATLKDSVPNSSHVLGHAADIAITPATKLKIAKALYAAGFRRFGFANSYIHVDNDPSKPVAIWNYGGASTYTYNQLA